MNGQHLDEYLRDRESLRGLVLIMDIRKPLTEFDIMILGLEHTATYPHSSTDKSR